MIAAMKNGQLANKPSVLQSKKKIAKHYLTYYGTKVLFRATKRQKTVLKPLKFI